MAGKYRVMKADGTLLEEPVFVLRAQDLLAAGAVMVYAELVYTAANVLAKAGQADEASRLLTMAGEVREIGRSFYDWKLANSSKLPD